MLMIGATGVQCQAQRQDQQTYDQSNHDPISSSPYVKNYLNALYSPGPSKQAMTRAIDSHDTSQGQPRHKTDSQNKPTKPQEFQSAGKSLMVTSKLRNFKPTMGLGSREGLLTFCTGNLPQKTPGTHLKTRAKFTSPVLTYPGAVQLSLSKFPLLAKPTRGLFAQTLGTNTTPG